MAQLQYSLSAAEEANNAAEDGEAVSPLPSPKKGGKGGGDAAKGGADPDAAARQALERTRTRWKKVWKTQVNCKAAVQHILDAVETVRLARDEGDAHHTRGWQSTATKALWCVRREAALARQLLEATMVRLYTILTAQQKSFRSKRRLPWQMLRTRR